MRLRDYEDIALALATAYGYVVALDVVGALLVRARTGDHMIDRLAAIVLYPHRPAHIPQ